MHRRLARFAWIVLAYNIAVVLWGAYVRATGSGAGCGSHWPTCNGEVIPRSPSLGTAIEFSHRASSGVALLLVVGLWIAALRGLPRGHAGRRASFASLVLILVEAAVGAGLVLFGLVAGNTSPARAWVMGFHLLTTFLLLASLALAAHWIGGGAAISWLQARREGRVREPLLALGGLLLVGATGAISALGDTLFPASSLADGLAQDLSPTAHILVRLRVLHPLIAAGVGVYLLLVCRPRTAARRRQAGALSRRLSGAVTLLVLLQLGGGLLNVALLAPVWLQMVHLLLADLLWVATILWTADLWSEIP